MPSKLTGPSLIALAALLWSTDALVRLPAVQVMDPTFIVFMEHLIGLGILLPWVCFKSKNALFRLDLSEWISSAIIGIGGSALATVFFTASFKYINPSVAILLQKLQPILVVILAFLILRERPRKSFYSWAILALGAALILSFPDFHFEFIFNADHLHSKGVFYSIAATALWAVSTVAGKILLKRTDPGVATFWRFSFGFVALGFLLLVSRSQIPWGILNQSSFMMYLLYMGCVPGIIAMVAYYGGLKRTSASVTTFVELLFPVSAVILNTVFLHIALNRVQLISGAVLLFASTRISLQVSRRGVRNVD